MWSAVRACSPRASAEADRGCVRTPRSSTLRSPTAARRGCSDRTATEVHPTARVFISHGTKDTVLPIDPCGRTVVATLQRLGYAVRYREFEGPHTVPPAVAREAIDWFTGASTVQ